MVRKGLFKYIFFALLMVFLFAPSVKASTKYLVCNYNNAKKVNHNIRLYYENSNGKFKLYYVAAYSKQDKKWNKYNSNLKVKNGTLTLKINKINNSAVQIYYGSQISSATNDGFNQNIMNLSSDSCPKITVYANGQSDQNLTAEKDLFELDDLSCKYESTSGSGTSGTYPFSSWFVGVSDLSKSNPKFTMGSTTYAFERFVRPSKDTGFDEYGYPTGLDPVHNYSDQTYMYSYLENASKYGCPRAIASGVTRTTGGVRPRFYPTYKWNLTSNDFSAIDISKDSYGVAKLVCNTDAISALEKEIENNYSFWENDFNYYASLDKSGWENVRNTTGICRNSKSTGEFIECFLNDKKESIVNDYDNDIINDNTSKRAKKLGCDQEALDLDWRVSEIVDKYTNLINELQQEGLITSEQADELIDGWAEAEETIDGLIDKLFYTDDSALRNLTRNKNKTVNCEDIFGSPCDKDSLSTMCFITTIFNILRYLIPAILIILGSIDFSKVVLSNDREAMSKAISTFVKRVIIAIAIFFLPLLINFLFQIFGSSGYTMGEKINCVIESLSGDSND